MCAANVYIIALHRNQQNIDKMQMQMQIYMVMPHVHIYGEIDI